MGIPITIIEEVIGRAARKYVDGNFEWNLNKKTSPWIKTTNDALYKASKMYKDMQTQGSSEAYSGVLLTYRRWH